VEEDRCCYWRKSLHALVPCGLPFAIEKMLMQLHRKGHCLFVEPNSLSTCAITQATIHVDLFTLLGITWMPGSYSSLRTCDEEQMQFTSSLFPLKNDA
jgi:hypothetical protein